MRTLVIRLIGVTIVIAAATAVATPVSASTRRTCTNPDGCVVVLNVNGLIDPIEVDYLERSMTEVSASPGYLQTIVVINSPGAVVSNQVLERLARHMRSQKVPVSVWVGPSGAEARGGAAELVAAVAQFGVATMAPGTSIGEVDGQRLSEQEFGRLFHGRAEAGGRSMLSADKAASAGVVDGVKAILGQHVVDLPGMKDKSKVVTDDQGRSKRQPLTDGVTQTLPLSSQLFHTVASPAVAYLMLALAIGLLLFEFFTAGVGVAGAVGAITAVLAGYGLGALPITVWALLCCLAAMVAFAVDIQTAIPRFWTAAGMVLWIVGSLGLFGDLDRPWLALVVGIGGMAVTMYSAMPAVVRSRFATPTIGRESMIGGMGTSDTDLNPEGIVRVEGALWRAITNRATLIEAGEAIRVVSIDGMILEVEPEVGGAADDREQRGHRSKPAREG